MTQFTHGHALIIGAGADLPSTVDDAVGLADILIDPQRCAYPPEQVRRLTGLEATRGNILDGLRHLAGATNEESTAIVFFSGHGYEVRTGIGTQYFLLPNGYRTDDLPGTAVSGRELSDALRAIPARKLLLLLDCCHAGGLDDIKAPTGIDFVKAPIPAEAIALLTEGSGRASIASCMAGELSFAGRPYSAFTRALLEAFCGRGAARADGFVRVTDLALHTRQMVPGRTGDRQHPTLHYERGDNFRVAYYAGGDATPKGLPFPEEAEIEPEPGAFRGIRITTYQANATDHSTIAQGPGATAVGARGVNVGGKVGGHIVTGSGNTIYAGTSPENAPRPMSPYLVDLHEKLDRYFNESDLKDLCFVIGVDYESLGGLGKRSNARELVLTCERNGRLPQLVRYCRAVRPSLDWPRLNNGTIEQSS